MTARRFQWAAVALMAFYTAFFIVIAVVSPGGTRVAFAALAGVAFSSTFWMAYLTRQDAA